MSSQNRKEKLKQRILQEMTVDYSKVLEQDFDLAKQLFRLTKDGDVEILVREKISGKEEILLYLIGKLYAREAGLTSTEEVGNEEFLEKLGMPTGSLLPWLKTLRDSNIVKQIRREGRTYHIIRINLVDKILKKIMKKIKKTE